MFKVIDKYELGNKYLLSAKKNLESLGFDFQVASDIEDINYGVDCYINNIPTDVKYTNYIFFLKYNTKERKFVSRHPFKHNTKSTHYLFVDIKTKKFNHIPITEYLKSFFKNDECFFKFVKIVSSLNDKKINDTFMSYCVSDEQVFKLLKVNFLIPLLNKNSTVLYSNYDGDSEKIITFRLKKYV